MNKYYGRIEALRALMRSRGWDAVILTGSDPHGSEYPAERYKQVRWLTGFTGECGDVVVTADHAGLWTDTRYFIQANKQLDGTGVELHKTRVPEQVLIPEWLAGYFSDQPEPTIAFDGAAVGTAYINDILAAFGASEPVLVSAPDFLSLLWTDRPALPQTPVVTAVSGYNRSEKIEKLRQFCSTRGCGGILLTALDEVAWTLDVRASDIDYNPLVISYLLITHERVCWFVLKDPVEDPDTELTFTRVSADGVEIERYDAVDEALQDLAGSTLYVDESTLNWQLHSVLESAGVEVVSGPTPVAMAKAVKTPFEVEGMRACHIRDGVAMVRFLYWLEKSIQADRRITEWDASVHLESLRASDDRYRGDSFETISAYGPGAALPHYVTPHQDAPVLEPHGLYLCDSGGQYTDGTTDITRTVPLGECTQLEREDYTLVLKGHIDLAMAVFPEGTPGARLDVLAREPLWRHGRNFGHGTGHGVGYWLCVHEGPHDMRQNLNPVPFRPGMVITDEPGLYREGMHGIRHENVLLCVAKGENDFGKWLGFESLTLCPFETSILELDLLDRAEIDWLNAYHSLVYDTLAPLLEPEVARWLQGKCRKIAKFAE